MALRAVWNFSFNLRPESELVGHKADAKLAKERSGPRKVMAEGRRWLKNLGPATEELHPPSTRSARSAWQDVRTGKLMPFLKTALHSAVVGEKGTHAHTHFCSLGHANRVC